VTLLVAQRLYPHDLTLLIFPAWLVVAQATSGDWPRAQSTGWLALVIVGFALPLLTFMFAQRAIQAVVPAVLLMTIAMIALA
jgi:hypothetical protein